jgi:hypothetical protein
MEHPRYLWSSMWILGEVKYKGIDQMRTKIMECVNIYGYVSFALGVLFLIGLILFTWVALQKIWNVLTRSLANI